MKKIFFLFFVTACLFSFAHAHAKLEVENSWCVTVSSEMDEYTVGAYIDAGAPQKTHFLLTTDSAIKRHIRNRLNDRKVLCFHGELKSLQGVSALMVNDLITDTDQMWSIIERQSHESLSKLLSR